MRRLDEPADAVERFGELMLGIAAEQACGAVVGMDQAQQDPHRGRLAGAVGPEEPVDVACVDGEIDAVDGNDRPVALHEAAGLERKGRVGAHSPATSRRRKTR